MALSRLHSLIRRAQQRGPEVSQEPDDDDFVSGFRHFRQGHNQRAGSSRPQLKPVYTIHLVCLDGPNYHTVHSGLIRKMNEKGLGSRTMKVKRKGSRDLLGNQIRKEFNLPLHCTFKLMKAVKDEQIFNLEILEGSSVADLKAECNRSKIYVLPDEQISNRSNDDSSHEDSMRNVNTEQDVSLPTITRPHRTSHIHTLAVIANVTADLMEHSGDEELPDPGLNVASPNQNRGQSLRSPVQQQIGNCQRNSDTQGRGRGRGRGRRRTRMTSNNRNSVPTIPRNEDDVHIPTTQSNENTIPATPNAVPDITDVDKIIPYQSAGTPTVLFRTSTNLTLPIEPRTSESVSRVMDMDIGSYLTDVANRSSISDFIPEVAPVGDLGQIPSIERLKNTLQDHRKNFIKSDPEDPFIMEVRRGFVVQDALALVKISQEDLYNELKISFCGEDGVDLGGLRREFWSLIMHSLTHSCYVKGKPGRLTFQQNFVEKRKMTFFHLGQLIALSIIQDGPGLPIFSDIVTNYILNTTTDVFSLDDLPDGLKGILTKMKDCSSDLEIQNAYCSIMDVAMDAGFLVPLASFTKSHISILQAALIENQISSCKDELDQFLKGLDTHQVLSVLRQEENKASARGLFSGRIRPLTVNTLRSLLNFKYATGNRAVDQLATGQGFLTFLQATKGDATVVNGIKVDPKDVLMWLTGSSTIPAVGFHKLIDVDFGERTFVNTCALCLTLKTDPDLQPADAVLHYTSLIINSQTFTNEQDQVKVVRDTKNKMIDFSKFTVID